MGTAQSCLIVFLAKVDGKPRSSSPIGRIDTTGIWWGGEILLHAATNTVGISTVLAHLRTAPSPGQPCTGSR